MKSFRNSCLFAALLAMLVSGCGSPHGQPRKGSETIAPK